MKTIRIAGLGIFILSVLIFISTLFLGSFSLSENAIQKTFKGKNPKTIENFVKIAQQEGILNAEISNPMSFIEEKISPLIEKYNAKTTADIAKEKGLSSQEIDLIIANSTKNNQVNYSKSILENIFKTQPEKITIVDNATNWMYSDSKKYDKIEDFKMDFILKIEDINKTNASELLIYDNKYIQYDIAKASSAMDAMIMDFEQKKMFTFLTNEGKKTLMAIGLKTDATEKYVEEENQKIKITKTSQTKTIADYKCDGYLLENGKDKENMLMWISQNNVGEMAKLARKMSTGFSSMNGKSNAINYMAYNAHPEFVKIAEQGRMVLGFSVKGENGEETEMEFEDIKPNDKFLFATSAYKSMF